MFSFDLIFSVLLNDYVYWRLENVFSHMSNMQFGILFVYVANCAMRSQWMKIIPFFVEGMNSLLSLSIFIFFLSLSITLMVQGRQRVFSLQRGYYIYLIRDRKWCEWRAHLYTYLLARRQEPAVPFWCSIMHSPLIWFYDYIVLDLVNPHADYWIDSCTRNFAFRWIVRNSLANIKCY